MKTKSIVSGLLAMGLLTGCTQAAQEPVTSNAEGCAVIDEAITAMMATFEDQTASEASVAQTFSIASVNLASIAGSSGEEVSAYATKLSIQASKLSAAIAEGDGETTILTVNELFTSFSEAETICPAG